MYILIVVVNMLSLQTTEVEYILRERRCVRSLIMPIDRKAGFVTFYFRSSHLGPLIFTLGPMPVEVSHVTLG